MTRRKEDPMTAAAHPTSISKRSHAGSQTGGCAADATSLTPPSMTDSPTRAAAYVRESTEEQGQGFSPDAQRQAIAAFAAENTLELIGEYCDFHSGWRKSEARPEFQRLMADAADGKFDVVLVYHTSRFARNQVEARRYKQLLRERLGIRFVSVTQPMGEDHTDPSAFLAESIHEMFDEYYSVSLSFWTRSGLREKARQGHLVGSLPWGYVRDPATKLAVADPERAPLVLAMFERYATGQESDRTLAAWLNAKGARSARGRLFGKDTVREMLSNLAYAGYVCGMRDKSRSIRGLHEAIIPEELFDRVQEVRSWRARVVKAGRPSEEYLLRKLLCCERCGARMHGCRTGRNAMRRYQCSTRRHHSTCEQRTVPAIPIEEQLIGWLHDFQPDNALRRLVLDTIQVQTGTRPGEDAERRRQLTSQLERLRDLYVMGDLTKPEYVMRRQALEEELQRTKPPTSPDLDRAAAILEDFTRFWDAEPEPAERRKLVLSLFEQVWQKDGQIIAVKPHHTFAGYFTAASEGRLTHPKADADDEATKAGATGVGRALDNSSRSGRRSSRKRSIRPKLGRSRPLSSTVP
jgi:DNA invertase Pin-like site-specific DNA recombinase